VRLDDGTRRRLSSARDMLEAEYTPASIAHIAQRAGMSQFHFIRMFEATFGVTPHRYRTGVRLERARHMLARGLPVT
jgi:AraC-like DNA-binding protein